MTASTSTVWAAAGLNIAVTGVVAAMAYTVMTNQWSTAHVLGQHTAAVSNLLEDIRDVKQCISDLRARTDKIETQLRVANTDVVTLLAEAGFPIDKNVKIVWVNDEFVLFPQTETAVQHLRDQKFEPVQITPSVSGFTLDPRSAEIVKAVMKNSADAAGGGGWTEKPEATKTDLFTRPK